METAVHNGRRDERVPLDALIELHSDESAEVLEADGLDLSPGGSPCVLLSCRPWERS